MEHDPAVTVPPVEHWESLRQKLGDAQREGVPPGPGVPPEPPLPGGVTLGTLSALLGLVPLRNSSKSV